MLNEEKTGQLTLFDIVRISQEWQLKEIPSIAQNILPKLETMMGGKIVYENEEFYIDCVRAIS